MEIEQLMLQTAAVVPLDEGEDPGAQKAGSGITSSGYAPGAETRSDDMTTKKGMHSAIVVGRSFSRRR